MNRGERQHILERERAMFAQGRLTPAEQVAYDEQRAWEMYEADKRRQAQQQRVLPEAA